MQKGLSSPVTNFLHWLKLPIKGSSWEEPCQSGNSMTVLSKLLLLYKTEQSLSYSWTAFRHSCISFHCRTWKINPEAELANSRVCTTSEMAVWEVPCQSHGRGNCFSASLLGGKFPHRNQDKHSGRTQGEPKPPFSCCNAPPRSTAVFQQQGPQHSTHFHSYRSYNPQRILQSLLLQGGSEKHAVIAILHCMLFDLKNGTFSDLKHYYS